MTVRLRTPPHPHADVADTPEGRAVRSLPPDLARRVIAELAAGRRGAVTP